MALCFYRKKGQCHEFKFKMEKTEEPNKYTTCESAVASPWADGSLSSPTSRSGYPLTFHVVEVTGWSILETDWFLLLYPAQLLTQKEPKTGKPDREVLKPGANLSLHLL